MFSHARSFATAALDTALITTGMAPRSSRTLRFDHFTRRSLPVKMWRGENATDIFDVVINIPREAETRVEDKQAAGNLILYEFHPA